VSTDPPHGWASLVRAVPVGAAAITTCLLAWETTGSIRASSWLPYGIVVLLVLAAVLLARAAVTPAALPTAATTLLVCFAIWTIVSASWAPSAALARNDGLLSLLYAAVFLTPLVTLRSRRDRLTASALAVGALTALCLVTAVWLWSRGNPEFLYFAGRLDFPITYWNGEAALALVGFWPAIVLASRSDAAVAVRAMALCGSTGMLLLWLGTQSKGGGVALAISALVVFAVSRYRLRLLVPTLAAGALAAAGAADLTEPFRADSAVFDDAVRHAGTIVVVLMLAGAVAGAVYAVADRRLDIPEGVRSWLAMCTLTAIAAIATAGIVFFFVRVHHPIRDAEQRWSDFTHQSAEGGASHFSQLGSNRYDFWRVAWQEFERHPVVGIGSFGWGDAYLIHRDSPETPQRSHSLEMDALSETGISGCLLVISAGIAALVAVGRRARNSVSAAGALGAGAYFMIHTGGDWVWTIPAVGMAAMLLVGIGASGDARPPLASGVSIASGVALVGLALAAFAPPWISSRLVERAYDSGSAAAASSDLRWARRLDPLAIEPLIAESALAPPPANIAPLRRAVAKQPRTSALHYLLGLAYLDLGRKTEARAELQLALALSPEDEAITKALDEAR
jgi:hypothetical protein